MHTCLRITGNEVDTLVSHLGTCYSLRDIAEELTVHLLSKKCTVRGSATWEEFSLHAQLQICPRSYALLKRIEELHNQIGLSLPHNDYMLVVLLASWGQGHITNDVFRTLLGSMLVS